MRIQYCSDLHLEFPLNKKYLKDKPIIPEGDILLLAGDVAPFIETDEQNEFFDFVSDHFDQTYWVPGNHEYYRSDIAHKGRVMCERIRSNVSLVNNYSIEYNNIRFIFSTLWSKIGPVHETAIRKSMADFRLIKNDGKILSIEDYNALHDQCINFLVNEFQKRYRQKTIVVSHHIPTYLNYPEKFRHSPLNEAFAVELFDLIQASGADYWIFGHTHEVVPDFKIGETIMTTNQLGYVEYGEHAKFVRNKVVEVTSSL